MMVRIGPYMLMGMITVFMLGLGTLIVLMVMSSMRDKKAAQIQKESPRVDTLAEQIKNQFKVKDEENERRIYTKSGVSKTSVKETRSAFSFQETDAETGISLESEYDDGLDNSFLESDKEK